jgi:hypothetical protein
VHRIVLSLHAILASMRSNPGQRRHLQMAAALPAIALAVPLVLAACGTGSPTPTSPRQTSTTATAAGAAPTTTTTSASAGPLQVGAPIALPFSADRVTAAESPDGAVFAAPQDPSSPSPTVAWVVDGNGPALVAEHVATGIAAVAADANNFYVATYTTLIAYNRTSGNQDGQWTMPSVPTANSSNNDLVALAAANGSVFISVTRGNTVSVYSLNPGATTTPRLVVTGLGDAVGSDGSIYYERTDHRLAARRPNGATSLGPALADTPNGEGGGVQYLDVVAGGAVWISEPAGQGLDATDSTYDAATLHPIGSFQGSVTTVVVDSTAGALALESSGSNPACPQASPSTPTSCVFNIVAQGTASNAVGVGSAVTLIGPQPAVIASDTGTGQFDVLRLS